MLIVVLLIRAKICHTRTWIQFLAMTAPGRVELHKDHILGEDEVGEGVSVEDVDTLVVNHFVVALI